jgi:glycosyltransferase involved in cell wall biosynthesis
MRLLIATQHFGMVGGVETYLRAVLPGLVARGFEVAVLAETGEPTGGILADCPSVRAWTTRGKTGGDLLALAGAEAPEVVYTHGLGEPALEDELSSRFPTVYYGHNYGGLCISGTKCHGFPGPQPCSRPLGPACLALYLPRRCGGRNPLTMLGMYRTERRRRRVLGSCRAVLVASRHMAAEMARNGVAADRVHIVPYPVATLADPTPPSPRSRTGRVLFVGRITELKGWSHLIDAVPRAAAALGRPLTLVVAGDGPDRAKFELAAGRAGIRAEFLGWVGPEQREAEMRKADVLVVPSVWPEPFGLVGIEAGCVGLPAVAYAVGGIPDWLTPGESGESAPGDRPDPRELAAAIVRAVGDQAHWQRLRVGAWKTAQRFTPDAHLDLLVPILEAAAR